MTEKTERNLAYAFAAESKASVRNEAFARKADMENYRKDRIYGAVMSDAFDRNQPFQASDDNQFPWYGFVARFAVGGPGIIQIQKEDSRQTQNHNDNTETE